MEVVDAENSQHNKTNLSGCNEDRVRKHSTSEKIKKICALNKKQAANHQRDGEMHDSTKNYNFYMGKLFRWAKSRKKLVNGRLPTGSRLGRLVTFYKNSIRYQGEMDDEGEISEQDESVSKKFLEI